MHLEEKKKDVFNTVEKMLRSTKNIEIDVS